jgi:hypothetical protein
LILRYFTLLTVELGFEFSRIRGDLYTNRVVRLAQQLFCADNDETGNGDDDLDGMRVGEPGFNHILHDYSGFAVPGMG